jgi:integrase
VSQKTWWRAAIILLWTYGFRRCELFDDLTWRRIDPELGPQGVFFDQRSPITAVDLQSEHGWLIYSPKKQSWAKPGVLLLPLTRAARLALERVRLEMGLGENDWPRTPVLPGPKCHPSRDRTLKSMRRACGIDLHFTLHDLRRTCETFWNGVEPNLGTYITGHAGRSVSDQSYDQKLVRLVALLPSLEARGDYPRAFCSAAD